MLIGIDVGGTFTDGVLFDEGRVIASAKKETREEDLKSSLLQVLDELLRSTDPGSISRVVLSTTLVTNMLATGRGEKTAMVMLPGYGLPHDSYDIPGDIYFIKGAIDFRGREIEKLDEKEIEDLLQKLQSSGVKRVAVACKFSNRNDVHEKILYQRIKDKCPEIEVSISSEISGKLNFPRRAASTFFTAMTLSKWKHFTDEMEAAMKNRKIKAEIHILKADGGTMPLKSSRSFPCETVFSGPAASTMGAVALTRDKMNSVVVDIGGTTTDLSLIINGEPLYASKGAVIENKLTQVDSFAVRSIALGGDSLIVVEDAKPMVKPYREGPAACFDGKFPTVTDVFNLHLKLNIGDKGKSQAALDKLANDNGMTTADLCAEVYHIVINHLQDTIGNMFRQWENEPAYKVWEVINKRKFELHRVIGIGAAAHAIVPALAAKMEVESFIHQYAPVANALGASVVRPTLSVRLHVDTERNKYSVDPGGYFGELEKPGRFQIDDARTLAYEYLLQIGKNMGVEEYCNEYKYFMEEQFNMVRGWDRSGKLFDVGIQVSPGFINEYQGVK